MELILLDEISMRLTDIFDKLDADSPSGDFRLVPFSVNTGGTLVLVSHNERLINDGDADIYILPEKNSTITSEDAPVKIGEVVTLAKTTKEATPYYLKTLTGTASARFVRGAERSRVMVDVVAQTIANMKVDVSAQSIGNLAVNIAASAITLQVNIASQSANIAVSIAAQTLSAVAVDIKTQTVGNLAVNIAAQSIGNLAVNIAASAITLNVNISSTTSNINVNIAAQSGNVTISVVAQTVSIDTFRDWNSKQGKAKPISGSGGAQVINYSVTAGKTYYLSEWSVSGDAAKTFTIIVDGVTDEEHLVAANVPFVHPLTTPIPATSSIVLTANPSTGSHYGNILGVEI